LQSQPKPRKTKEKVSSDLVNNLTMNELSRKFNNKVLERMKAIATGHGDEVAPSIEAEPTSKAAKPARAKKAAKPKDATEEIVPGTTKKPVAARKPRASAEPKSES